MAAVELLRRLGVLPQILGGDITGALTGANREWASLPGSPYGQPTRSASDPGRGFNKACELAGISDVRWHDLRHTFGTWLSMARTPMPVIKEVMGHTDVRTTDRYVHLAAEQTRETVENLALWQERQKNGKKRGCRISSPASY